ncbi:DUF3179 domain-containing protein [Roseovarius sp. D0-M9]|uniref:DUF3179 domain-containing protein n=1 Tax=Roseovarius sp. D0-M9 TaxID=3127117 RepID=UPI00300FF2AF
MRTLAIGAIALALFAGQATADARRFAAEWPQTDFNRTMIHLDEVISGGPGKDGIPALSDPDFIAAANETQLNPREPVLTYAPEGQVARAYPIRYLMWHEIVNDTVAGTPIAVTFCPLCNSGMIFDRRVAGETLTFAVSGLLRNSDMVMYDRQSQSWWQQAVGQGIVGRHAGTELAQLVSWMESWEAFRTAHPDGLVMQEPDWGRNYGQNPYVSYDSSIRPFLYSGENPPHGVDPLARVLRVGNRAWPMDRLRRAGRVTEAGVTITWTEGQASALDSPDIGAGREVGNVRVQDANGRDVAHDIPFAFAFHAFFPDGQWMLGK